MHGRSLSHSYCENLTFHHTMGSAWLASSKPVLILREKVSEIMNEGTRRSLLSIRTAYCVHPAWLDLGVYKEI